MSDPILFWTSIHRNSRPAEEGPDGGGWNELVRTTVPGGSSSAEWTTAYWRFDDGSLNHSLTITNTSGTGSSAAIMFRVLGGASALDLNGTPQFAFDINDLITPTFSADDNTLTLYGWHSALYGSTSGSISGTPLPLPEVIANVAHSNGAKSKGAWKRHAQGEASGEYDAPSMRHNSGSAVHAMSCAFNMKFFQSTENAVIEASTGRGVILIEIQTPQEKEPADQLIFPRGVKLDGTKLWVISNDNIKSLNSDTLADLNEDIPTPPGDSGINDNWGITKGVDNNDLWITNKLSSTDRDEIIKADKTDGSKVRQFPSPGKGTLGIAWNPDKVDVKSSSLDNDPGFLWVLGNLVSTPDSFLARLYKINLSTQTVDREIQLIDPEVIAQDLDPPFGFEVSQLGLTHQNGLLGFHYPAGFSLYRLSDDRFVEINFLYGHHGTANDGDKYYHWSDTTGTIGVENRPFYDMINDWPPPYGPFPEDIEFDQVFTTSGLTWAPNAQLEYAEGRFWSHTFNDDNSRVLLVEAHYKNNDFFEIITHPLAPDVIDSNAFYDLAGGLAWSESQRIMWTAPSFSSNILEIKSYSPLGASESTILEPIDIIPLNIIAPDYDFDVMGITWVPE